MTTSSGSLAVTQLTLPPRMTAAHRQLPTVIASSGARASLRFLESFAARIRKPNTQRACGRAVAKRRQADAAGTVGDANQMVGFSASQGHLPEHGPVSGRREADPP